MRHGIAYGEVHVTKAFPHLRFLISDNPDVCYILPAALPWAAFSLDEFFKEHSDIFLFRSIV